MPVEFLKARVKLAWDEKPAAMATSATFQFSSSSL
jgi:hypothetical protein